MAPSSRPTATSRQRQPSSLSQVQTPPSTKSKKTTKPSRIVILKLESSLLAQFQSVSSTPEPVEKKKTPKAASTNSTSSVTVRFESEASNSVQGPDDNKASDAKEDPDATDAQTGVKRKLDADENADENGDDAANKAQRKRPKV